MSGRGRRGLRPQTPARIALRFGPRMLLLVAVLLLPICAALGGGVAVAGAATALAVVAGFFTVSVLAVEAANRIDPSMTLPVALTVYAIKVIVLGAAAFAVPESWGSARPAFAAGLIVGALTWLLSQAIGVWRTPLHYVDMSLAKPEHGRSC